MSDRTFVLAMWQAGHREWDDGYALDFVLTSAEAFSRSIISARTHLLVLREVRESQRGYEQLRLDGVAPAAALEQLVNRHLDKLGRPGPSTGGRHSGGGATHP